MIRTLIIHNIALIEKAEVRFHSGLTVLSGETGAGKSIIVDAVTLILGGRADRELIRSGSEKATVEAEFDACTSPVLKQLLAKEEIDYAGDSVVLFREISLTGRNICRINGIIVPVSVMKETAALLLNLHGQSEHQFLADEEKQLSYLDLMGDASHREMIRQTAEACQRFIENHRMYARLVKKSNGKEQRIDYLSHELEELKKIDFHTGEEEELTEQCRHLNKAARIHDRIQNIAHLIAGGREETDSLHNLQAASRELRNLGSEDSSFEKLADRCEALYFELEEIVYGINALNERYEYDPFQLEDTQNRLESVRRILKKYGPAEKDVLNSREEMADELRLLTELDDRIRETGAEHKRLLAQYRSKAKELTSARRKIADDFRNRMMEELRDLGMGNTVIDVMFEENQTNKPLMPTPSGDDRIHFLMSPNPGEPLKPMSRIASGGELSRLMLALKTIESGRSGIQTMIFDEIDTGISGRMAQAVAEKLFSISRYQQVICISHLPQIAAAADHQYLVHKETADGRTVTEVQEMDRTHRIDDIARMISGAEGITEDARQYAGRLIEAFERKNRASGITSVRQSE